MTPQDWKEVEERLQSLYSIVKLNCDGCDIALSLVRITQMKNVIAIYVNGEFKGKWLFEDCEERRRFARPIKRSLYTQKQKAKMEKTSKKLRQKYGLPDPDKSYTYYWPHWNSFRSLKSHLVKNNNSIELVKVSVEA